MRQPSGYPALTSSHEYVQLVALTTYAHLLESDLTDLGAHFVELLDRSGIVYSPPDQFDRIVVITSSYSWAKDDQLVPERAALRQRLGEWAERLRVVWPNPLRETTNVIDEAVGRLSSLLTRDGYFDTPSSIEEAKAWAATALTGLRRLIPETSVAPDFFVVPDTNVLLRNPDVTALEGPCGTDRFIVVLVPTVLAELDEQKDRGRTPEVREAAAKALTRIKGLRDRGDLRMGVTVQKNITLRATHREPRAGDVLDWLDHSVPDDRILADALELQGQNSGDVVTLCTGDMNLQNKAAVAGLPFVDP